MIVTDDLQRIGQNNATVLELLDRLLNAGVVVAGDLAINVADIELIYFRLQLMLSSAETARQAGWLPERQQRGPLPAPHAHGDVDMAPINVNARHAHGDVDMAPNNLHVRHAHEELPPSRPPIQLDPDNARNGIAQLVLTVVELLRDLLERQALRRIEGGSLRPDEEERLGLTFLRLSEEMDRVKQQFQLTDEDLNLDLGPLGKLR
jgi:hypothetical protein